VNLVEIAIAVFYWLAAYLFNKTLNFEALSRGECDRFAGPIALMFGTMVTSSFTADEPVFTSSLRRCSNGHKHGAPILRADRGTFVDIGSQVYKSQCQLLKRT